MIIFKTSFISYLKALIPSNIIYLYLILIKNKIAR